ncbi:hypothetical protein Acr_09g0005600 [Actinidia rufa]|uniref:Uncharacterized protein n=1 Tax=Actinidia rufa TaxID=165716 RepID=A0A7J0F5Z1_9ERIC|nr:hypothetical protein Acr_09g0005600 [Actinidia rufa]
MVLMRERTVVLEGAAADGGLKERGDEFFGGGDMAEVRRGDVLEEDVGSEGRRGGRGVAGGEIGGGRSWERRGESGTSGG